MLNIHVVSRENADFYSEIIDEYHRQRYSIFVEEKGWRGVPHHNGRERDQFDDDSAVYLIVTHGSEVVGGHRFHPTTRPHMLSEVFPYLVQWPLPQGPDVWEATRYYVKRERRSGLADPMLMIATYQLCLEEGISQVTGILETSALPRRIQAGLKLRPLGLPQDVDGESVIAVTAEMSEEGFARMLKKLRARPLKMIRRGLREGDLGGRRYAA